MVAKISALLVPLLFRGRLLAVLRITDVVLNAHLANVQLRPTRLARVQSPQWQAQICQRCTTAPAH